MMNFAGKPFFAAMSAQPPHNPYVAPPVSFITNEDSSLETEESSLENQDSSTEFGQFYIYICI